MPVGVREEAEDLESWSWELVEAKVQLSRTETRV